MKIDDIVLLTEGATSVLYHYAGITSARDILRDGVFKLSSTTGNPSEAGYAPPGYQYFLSTTRSRVGDYHRYVGSGAAMFVLDGDWFSQRYPVKPVDYWERAWQHSPDRTRESEDRVFSKDNEISIGGVRALHVLMKEQSEVRSPATREMLIMARKRGIPSYLYMDEKAWRLQDTRRAVTVAQAAAVLRGPKPSPRSYRSRNFLEEILEMIFKKNKAELTAGARKRVQNLLIYGSRHPTEDDGLGVDMSNARKPGSSDYDSAVKINQFMRANGLKNTVELKNHLVQKWEATDFFKESLEEGQENTAMMGKLANSGKIIRILRKQHSVPFSNDKDWLLVDVDPALGNRGLGIKWIPASTKFTWVRPYLENPEIAEAAIDIGQADHRAQDWIDRVYDLYPATWQNNHVMTWGEGDQQQLAFFELIPSMSKKHAVEVKWFQAYPLRQGVGSRAMQQLQTLAREDGIALTLYPWDKGQVSQAKLTKFYKAQGFKPTVKGAKNMMWTPETVAEGLTQDRNLSPITKKYIKDHVWKLTTVNPMTLDIDSFDDPFNRVIDIDTDYQVDFKQPIIVHANGTTIIDGFHRAYQAQIQGLKQIPAYVPVKQDVTESKSVAQEIKEFINSLAPDDVGVEEFPGYRVHFEGFTDDCKSSSDYQQNPDAVYQQVYQDFIDREGGVQPVKSGMVGTEDYPVLYSVFKAPQSNIKQGVAENFLDEGLRVDVPNEEWLQDAIDYAKQKSPDRNGLPYMGKTTATVRSVDVPVDILKRIPGMRREQQNVRQADLAAIIKIMSDTGKLPLGGHTGEEYKPFINVAYDGSAWVNEGNHRIMAAAKLGWKTLPVEISYFDGGERVESGAMYPPKIGLGQVAESRENFNGIDISMEIQKDDEYVDDEDYDNQVLYVTASSKGKELGHVLFAFDGEYLMPQDLEVEERYRGQGIAQIMYDYVKSKGYKIRRSGQQTDAGAGFWDKHKPGKNVWEQGVAESREKFNTDLMKPGFRWSEEINGITYLVRTQWDNMPEVIARVNNREVGRATFIDYHTQSGLESVSTYVSPKWQGHGIAKNMYAVIRMLGANIQPSATQTAMGKDMWAKWKKGGDTKHLTSMNAKMDQQGVNEGGWASTATQNTVITPAIIEEALVNLNEFAREYNVWQAQHELGLEIKIGKPKGSGTYYTRDLVQDPAREYGDIDIECFIHSKEGTSSAQLITQYKNAITEFTKHNPEFSSDNGTNIIMNTSAGPAQVDLIYTFNEHANWSRALSPEYRVKGVISTSLTSALAEALNLSFGSQGIQVKTRAGRPVSFRQSRDTELKTITTTPESWARDIFQYYYTLANGQPYNDRLLDLDSHPGLKDEQRLSDIVHSIRSLAAELERNNLLGTGALDYIGDANNLLTNVAKIYANKLETVINSSKFDKAETPAAEAKAKKTKLMLAKYRNEITKLLLN